MPVHTRSGARRAALELPRATRCRPERPDLEGHRVRPCDLDTVMRASQYFSSRHGVVLPLGEMSRLLARVGFERRRFTHHISLVVAKGMRDAARVAPGLGMRLVRFRASEVDVSATERGE